MRNISLLLLGSLVVVGCKSKKNEAPAAPAKAEETAAKHAPAAPPLTDSERAKMERKTDDELEKEKLVAEAGKEAAKDQEAKGIPAAETATKAMLDGSYDFATSIDPTSALVFVDFTATPAVERASCGPAPKELVALAAEGMGKSVYCSQLPTQRVRCAVPLVAANDASSDFDELIFEFEIVMGDAQLRAFGKRHLAGTPEARAKMFAEHDAKIIALGKKGCPDAHGP
ncbi:MAG: hypothetical protein SFX73_27740 [Kofleriaceae bacterium]|nr:hypothetical protein [Kofleriaceae bacterium]